MMSKIGLCLALLFASVNLEALCTKAWVGPHFGYHRIDFNGPSELQGYGGGVTAGAEAVYCSYFANVEFEGTWNAGPVTGRCGQICSFADYWVDGRVGALWCTNCFLIKPYTGFGWNRFENEELPGMAHLDYNFHKLFVPLGFYAIYCPYSCLRGGVQFEYRFDVSSKLDMTSVSMNLQKEHSLLIQLPLEYTYCRSFSVSLVRFYQWNQFGRCTEKNSVGVLMDIPSLTHWSAGLKLLVGAQF